MPVSENFYLSPAEIFNASAMAANDAKSRYACPVFQLRQLLNL